MNVNTILLFVITLLYSCNSIDQQFVDFRGVSKNSMQEYYFLDKELKTEDKLHLTAVLVYYGVPIKYSKRGEIQVEKSELDDLNLFYNFTVKAQDSIWLDSHIYMPNDH